MSGYTKMGTRSNSQLLVSLILLSVLSSQALALPLETYSTMRLGNGMLFDGPNEPDQNLGLSNMENDYLESSLPENFLSFLDVPRALNNKIHLPEKRHSDSLFTDSFSKFLRREALRKYLAKVLNEKIRREDNPNLEP
ncbi:VIP peptides isoform X2 [Notamacropus eugenii]|uniref:VIP peptides isoform X2 n=1 Tax=Notamacropus eugenii TaxID=9315 RepID=UPI003B685FF0